jgi:hypothetical protein
MGDAVAQRSFRKRKYVNSERVLLLEKALDLTRYLQQLSQLITQPIKIPSAHVHFPSAPKQNAQNFFSTKGIWQDEATHRIEVGKLYNSANLSKDRKQLLSLMVDESDTDSGGELEPLTVKSLHQMLKIHRKRRRYQTKCHEDPLNTQYKYYGAGLMSAYDRFPEHQKEVKQAFSYDFADIEEPKKSQSPGNSSQN